MKKLGGRDLCDILDRIAEGDEKTLSEFSRDHLINVLIHVGQCLAFSHARGVVHRDMKPANIMIGDYGEVMVLDWGLAKVWDMDDDEEVDRLIRSGQQRVSGRLTGKGDVQGTPFYMSPEQATETVMSMSGLTFTTWASSCLKCSPAKATCPVATSKRFSGRFLKTDSRAREDSPQDQRSKGHTRAECNLRQGSAEERQRSLRQHVPHGG